MEVYVFEATTTFDYISSSIIVALEDGEVHLTHESEGLLVAGGAVLACGELTLSDTTTTRRKVHCAITS